MAQINDSYLWSGSGVYWYSCVEQMRQKTLSFFLRKTVKLILTKFYSYESQNKLNLQQQNLELSSCHLSRFNNNFFRTLKRLLIATGNFVKTKYVKHVSFCIYKITMWKWLIFELGCPILHKNRSETPTNWYFIDWLSLIIISLGYVAHK